jgi:hypothetical protein
MTVSARWQCIVVVIVMRTMLPVAVVAISAINDRRG